MPMLHKSPEMQRIFVEPPLIAYHRDRNLTDILVHGKHNRIFKTREDSDHCPDEKCTYDMRDHDLWGRSDEITDKTSGS